MIRNIKSLTILLFTVLLTVTSVNINVLAAENADVSSKVIVSLGDSYSSGEGIDDFYDSELPIKDRVKSEDWLAHRSKNSWPGMLTLPSVGKMSEHRDENWYFAAASGALSYDIIGQQRKFYYKKSGLKIYKDITYLPPQIDIFNVLESNNQKADYITLTIGGNDAGFTDVVLEVVVNSSYNKYLFPSKLTDKINQTWGKFYKDYYDENNNKQDSIKNRIKDVYGTLSQRAGSQAHIIVAGYPQLFAEKPNWKFINEQEAEIVNNSVSNFNNAIESIVNKCKEDGMNISFVSVEEEFKGREAYSTPREDAWINEVEFFMKEQDITDTDGYFLKENNKSWEFQASVASAYSMHPNYVGAHDGYRKCVQDEIDRLERQKNSKKNISFGNNNDINNNHQSENFSSYERNVALVLDTSGSMDGTPIEETKLAATKFIDTILEQNASAGIVTYNSSATVVSPFSSNENSLKNAIYDLDSGGGTNIEGGLAMAESMLSDSTANKKIIVLMSDGEPNEGLVGDDLVAYADELKNKGIYIYTLGFFESLSSKTDPQALMEKIASDGCHYEVSDADSLVFFFGDIADQINGQKYIYVRIACPVDVLVTYNGETLNSSETGLNTRTSFGTLTFEESDTQADTSIYGQQTDSEESDDDRVKILRLKEGEDYDIEIEGTGKGRMNYSIGFMNENGEYSDFRKFNNVKITRKTQIDTVAQVSDKTVLNVDEDGDGKYDLTYEARANERGKIVDNSFIIYLISVLFCVLVLLILILIIYKKIQKTKRNKLRRGYNG